MRAIVLLPLPLSPTRARMRPRCNSKLTSSTAWMRRLSPNRPARPAGKCLVRPLTDMIGSIIGLAVAPDGRRPSDPARPPATPAEPRFALDTERHQQDRSEDN